MFVRLLIGSEDHLNEEWLDDLDCFMSRRVN